MPGIREAEYRAMQDLRTRVLGSEHQVTIDSRHLRAMALYHLGKLAEAEAEHRAVGALWIRARGPAFVVCRVAVGPAPVDLGRDFSRVRRPHPAAGRWQS